MARFPQKPHYAISFLAVGGAVLLGLSSFSEPLLPSTDPFVLLAKDKITLSSDVTVSSGDVGVDEKKGALTIGPANALSSNLFASRIVLGPQTTINGSATFTTLTKTKDAEVLGDENDTFSSPLAPFPAVAGFQTGTERFRTNPDETAALSPGVFRSITTGPGTTLTLEPGTYGTETLVLGNDTTVHLLGATTVNVKGDAEIGNNVIFSQPNTLSIDDVAINSQGNELSIGKRSLTHGIITAPEATVTLGANALHRGQVVGRKITVGTGALLSREESFERESDPEKVAEDENGVQFIGNELVVLFKNDATLADAQAVADLVGGIITGFDPNPPAYKIELATDTVDNMKAAIQTVNDSDNLLVTATFPNVLAIPVD